MQSERLPAVEVEYDRARIAPKRSAVVPEKRFFQACHAARGQPFLVVDLAIDTLHEVGFGDAAVVSRIANRRDLLRHRDGGREVDRPGEPRVARNHLDLKQGDVRSRRLFDMQRSDELESELLRIVYLLKKVDVGTHLLAEPRLKRKAVSFSLRKLARHMAVGNNDVFRDQPAGADPIELRANEIDAATAGIATSSRDLAFVSRSPQILLSASSMKTSLVTLSRIVRTGRWVRMAMLSRPSISSAAWGDTPSVTIASKPRSRSSSASFGSFFRTERL